MNPPHLFILGAQKAGTTSLFGMLQNTGTFCCSNRKETGFFSKDILFNRGMSFFAEFFNHCNDDKYRLEATPAYLYYDYVAKRIFEFLPNAKFIVLLRDPTERCISAWNMYRSFNQFHADEIFSEYIQHSNGPMRSAIRELLYTKQFPSLETSVSQDIERFLKKSPDLEPSFVRRGLYAEQISEYLTHFPLDSFLFIEIRELLATRELMAKVEKFLNLNLPLNSFVTINNQGIYDDFEDIHPHTRQLLKEFYAPYNNALYKLIGRTYDWNV